MKTGNLDVKSSFLIPPLDDILLCLTPHLVEHSTCTCMYIYTHLQRCICTCMGTYAHIEFPTIWMHMPMHTYNAYNFDIAHTHACTLHMYATHAHLCTDTNICVHVHMYTCRPYRRLCVHTHACTCMSTRSYTDLLLSDLNRRIVVPWV